MKDYDNDDALERFAMHAPPVPEWFQPDCTSVDRVCMWPWEYARRVLMLRPPNVTNTGRELSLADLELSVRSRNCLDWAKIDTVPQLTALTRSEVLSIKNLGKVCLMEIEHKLSEHGLRLAQDPGR